MEGGAGFLYIASTWVIPVVLAITLHEAAHGYVAWKRGDPQKALTLYEKALKYSRPERPKKGVLGEGDTKAGRAFVLPESSKHQTLFDIFIRDLTRTDGTDFSSQMDNQYQKLDTFLAQIRDGIKP